MELHASQNSSSWLGIFLGGWLPDVVVSALQGISDSEQFTEVSTSPTSDSKIVSDINGSQVTLQGISDSKV
ncbi:unnamed protein product [Trifolium pratense]|uniref:Uncharacterized protein n=1 Tax=Trifolium pratense TaxID=57577 RepID=A0ACB0LCU2_TRIPR|nr:unnamed protein product [Trifolium pratense]